MNRKKLLYISTHRGCKEMDIILGTFAQHNIDKLTLDEIAIFERLLSESDATIYYSLVNIICKKEPIDNQLKYGEELLRKISSYNVSNLHHIILT